MPLTRVAEGRAALLEALVRFEKEHVQKGKAAPPKRAGSVVDLCTSWLESGPELAARTAKDYAIRLRSESFAKYWSRIRFKTCETRDVNLYLAARRADGAGASGNRDIGLIGGAYRWANALGTVSHRPTLGCVRNKEAGRGAEPPTWPQVDALIGQLMAVPDRYGPLAILVVAAWSTGARLSALMAMNLDALVRDPDADETAVSDVMALRWTETKTGRRIELKCAGSDFAVWLSMAAKAKRAEGVTSLFVRRDGKPWTESSVVQAMERVGSPFTFRTLRAGAATAAYAADRTNLLGHAAALARRYVRHTIGAPTPQS